MFESIRMLLAALAVLLHAYPDRGVLDGMARALAAETAPITGTLAHDAALMMVYAHHESRMKLHPRGYSWDGKSGLARGIFQIHGPIGDATPLEQATAWLAMLREGARLCPEAPAAPLSGGCTQARRLAQSRTLQAEQALAHVLDDNNAPAP